MPQQLTVYNDPNYKLILKQKLDAIKLENLTIQSLREILSRNNHKFIVSVLDKFYNMFGKIPYFASDIEVQNFVIEISKQYSNANTQRAYILGLKRIFTIGQEIGMIAYNPVSRLEKLKFITVPVADSKPNELQSNVTKGKIDHLMVSDKISKRAKAIILFLANTGCRSSELIGLRKGNVKKSHGEDFYRINMFQNKQGKVRLIKLPSDIWEYVEKNINKFDNGYKENPNCEFILQNRDGKKMSSQGLRYFIENAWKKLYIDDVLGAHKFRHFFITDKIIRECYDLKTVSLLVGHSSTSTTAVYVDTQVSEKDYASIQIPDKTVKPEVVYIDKSAEILAESMKRSVPIRRHKKGYQDNSMTAGLHEGVEIQEAGSVDEPIELSEQEILDAMAIDIPEEYLFNEAK